MTNRNLGVQFLSHDEVGRLKALDFAGHIGDPDPVGRMEDWQKKFGGTTEARPYSDGDSPTKHVEALRSSVRENGVQEPLHVKEWAYNDGTTSRSLTDGHHRAVAAHLEGLGAPAKIERTDVPWENPYAT